MLKTKAITEPQGMQRVEACNWLPVTELEEINKLRGDISVSLWIRRAIRKAIGEENEEEEGQKGEGGFQVTSPTSPPAPTPEADQPTASLKAMEVLGPEGRKH